MNCESRQDLIIQLVLGTLPEDDAKILRAHLESCPTCAAYAEEVRTTFGTLATALEPEVPSQDLKQRLIKRVRPVASLPMPQPSSGKEGRRGWPRTAWLLAVAAIIVVSACALFMVVEARKSANADRLAWTQAHQEELKSRDFALNAARDRAEQLELELDLRKTELVRATADLAAVRQQADSRADEIERLVVRLATQESLAAALQEELEVSEQVVAALQGQDALFINLANTADGQPDESARILLDPAANRWYLFTIGLPPLPENRIYQLWFVKDGVPAPVDTFAVNDEGRGLLYGQIPANIGEYQLAGITAEPAGGSEQPTSPIRILGSLQ